MISGHKKINLFILIVFTILLTGCSKQDKKIIDGFNNRPNDFEQTKDNVKVGVKFLTQKEFDKIFKGTSAWGKSKLIENHNAIQLQISNHNINKLFFATNSFDFLIMSPDRVNKMLKANAILTPLIISLSTFIATSALFLFSPAALIGAGIGSTFWLSFDVINLQSENKKNKPQINKIMYNPKEKITIESEELFSTFLITENKNLPNEFNVRLFTSEDNEQFLNFKITR